MILSVENQLTSLPQTLYSFLSTAGTAGGTALSVKNTNGFTAQWTIQLGKTGEETAELLNIDSVGGTVLNTSGTARFPHAQDTPIYQIHYDKIIFLRSTAGTAGTASALSTVSITPDSFYTEYDDTSGAATYAYKTQYYNSVNGDLSGTSGWFVPGGPTFYSLQRLRDRLKRNLYSAGFIKDDQTIDEWINEWCEEMTNSALKVNEAYSLGTAQYSFGTAGLGTITEPLFKYASKIETTTDGITWTQSTEIPLNQFSDGDTFTSVFPRHYWRGDAIFGILPTGSAGTARMSLGKINTQLVEDGDELPQFLRGYTAKCQEYLKYKAQDLDQKDASADKHYARFINGKNEFINEITPRDLTGPQFIDIEDSLTGNDDIFI